MPASWDIYSSGFTLIPSKAPTWLDAKFVSFGKLKGVYFVKDWDEDVRKNLLKRSRKLHRNPASIHFSDGEILPGYLIGEYDPKSKRFYFFPEGQSTDTVYILVERNSVKSVEQSPDITRV